MKPAWACPEFHRRGFALIAILIVAALVIGIGAILGYQKLTTKPSASPTPAIDQTGKDLSSETSVKEDETVYTEESQSANWKTYSDTVHKFSFKYPQGYTLEESQFYGNKNLVINKYLITLSPGGGGGYSVPAIYIKAYENLNLTLEDYFENNTTELSFDDPSKPLAPTPEGGKHFAGIKNKSTATLDGESAITFDYVNFESLGSAIVSKHEGRIFEIYSDTYNEQKDPKLESLFPQILSTFQFIN